MLYYNIGDVKMKENHIFLQKGQDFYYKTWHAIGMHMLIYIHSGTGSIVTEEKNYRMQKGCLCFVGADKFHHTLPDDPKVYVRSKIFLSGEVLARLLSVFPPQLGAETLFTPTSLVYARLSSAQQEKIEECLSEIHTSAEGYGGEAVRMCSYMQLLTWALNNATDSISPAHGLLQRAVEYINTHIAESITIEDICRASHISKYHFCRKFKETTGFTVMEYILKSRLTRAKSMLRNTRLPVSEISEKCGFSSISYFCRVFKEDEGSTPLRYRKQNAV